jgi:NinG protein
MTPKIPNKPVKPKACKSCGTRFVPFSSTSRACSPVCALTLAKGSREKAEKKAKVVDRKETKAKLEKFKKPTQWEAECRAIVQKIARLRDRDDGCISCHMGKDYKGRWHGSHFRPAGNNAAVQFHLWNINKACAQCNLFKGGNIGAYRPRLVEKIGLDRVEWLESQNQPIKTNVAYLVRFKAVMGRRLSRMEKRIKEQA